MNHWFCFLLHKSYRLLFRGILTISALALTVAVFLAMAITFIEVDQAIRPVNFLVPII